MLKVGQQYSEKRNYPRMTMNTDVTYAKSQDSSFYPGFCMNLSHSGILFVAEHIFTPGDSVVVILDTKNTNFKPLKATVEVLRIEPSDNKYMVAGKILEYQ